MQLNISGNELCGVDRYGRGTYTTEGIVAIADALKDNASVTSVRVSPELEAVESHELTHVLACTD